MPLPEGVAEHVSGQLDYYVEQAGSYRRMADEYSAGGGSAPDVAFGIIAGCVWSAFLEAMRGEGRAPTLDDVREFGGIVASRAGDVRRAVGP